MVLFVVARGQARLYKDLVDAFGDASHTRVVVDRRVDQRRRRGERGTTPERRRTDRRSQTNVQSHLSDLGWAVVKP